MKKTPTKILEYFQWLYDNGWTKRYGNEPTWAEFSDGVININIRWNADLVPNKLRAWAAPEHSSNRIAILYFSLRQHRNDDPESKTCKLLRRLISEGVIESYSHDDILADHHKRIDEAKTQQEKEFAEQDIKSTQRTIDGLAVLAMYGSADRIRRKSIKE
jgi:hypothetical protein